MPAKVSNVAWKCSKCGKRKWLKPGAAAQRQFCSLTCKNAGQRAAKPVRDKPGQRLARYGTRVCPACTEQFDARSPVQMYCSRECTIRNAQAARRKPKPVARPCESCGVEFTPRQGSAGRFCSRPCNFAGTKGARSPQWQGGKTIRADGYVMVRAPGHPSAQSHDYVMEHRLVMEQQLGRLLEKHETVHHINGDRADNRLENLQMRTGQHGRGAAFRCLDCGSTNVVSTKIAGA